MLVLGFSPCCLRVWPCQASGDGLNHQLKGIQLGLNVSPQDQVTAQAQSETGPLQDGCPGQDLPPSGLWRRRRES